MSNNVIRITDKLDVSDSNVVASSKATSELKNSVDLLSASKVSKSGDTVSGNLVVDGDVTVTGVINATIEGSTENAIQAVKDSNGNVIVDTYATKSEVSTKYLPLPGGTMTGPITFGNTGRITWDGSKKMFQFQAFRDGVLGAQIAVRAHDAPELPGTIVIQPRQSDGSGGVALIVYPDGTITTGSNAVITSAGGTVDGTLSIGPYDGIYEAVESSNKGIGINANSSAGRGAALALRDVTTGGAFALGARNASVTRYLFGYTDGRLTWDGKSVLTSANGVPMSTGSIAFPSRSGATATLPSGGTWRYVLMDFEDYTHASWGTAAGGATVTHTDTIDFAIAFKVA